MTANRFLAALCLLIVFAPASVAAPLKVEKRTVSEKKATFTIDVAYPHTGRAAIDAIVEGWAKDAVREFREQTADMSGTPGPWTLDIAYEVARNDEGMFAVAFNHASYTGGAHGFAFTRTYNFLRPHDVEVELPELFTGKGIKRISDLAVAQLKKDLIDTDGMSDMDWIRRGAGANARNLRSFVLSEKDLWLSFDPYQVAAYAAGPQEVRIPLAPIKGELRADPRAPASSFDCAKAKSEVEQAICSSRDLARLDRHVAEAYAEKLSWADDDAGRSAIRKGQRAWLATRDSVCLRAGQPLIACLSDSYQRRLRALEGG